MEQFGKAGIIKPGLWGQTPPHLCVLIYKMGADTWQYPPHRVGVRLIENNEAEQESVRLRPSGQYRDKLLGPHSVLKIGIFYRDCWIFKLGLHPMKQQGSFPFRVTGGVLTFATVPTTPHCLYPHTASTAAWPPWPTEFPTCLK